jgi:hypothetical protein
MTPRGAKAKGRTFQQYVRDELLKVFPSLEPDDVRSTAMGQSGEDIQLSPAARRLIPYNIECKSKARSQVHTYYDQAKGHGQHEPVVIVKMDRDIPLAVVSFDHFLTLINKNNNKPNEDS